MNELIYRCPKCGKETLQWKTVFDVDTMTLVKGKPQRFICKHCKAEAVIEIKEGENEVGA